MDPDKSIYKKSKQVDIGVISDKKLRVTVSHEDLRHSMTIAIVFTIWELVIDDIHCEMMHYPHEDCLKAVSALRSMIGHKVAPGIVKTARETVSDQGCTHLNNLFQEACYAVIQGQGLFLRQRLETMLPGLDADQINKIMIMRRPELLNSCVAFTPHTSLMRSIEKARLPRREDELRSILKKL